MALFTRDCSTNAKLRVPLQDGFTSSKPENANSVLTEIHVGALDELTRMRTKRVRQLSSIGSYRCGQSYLDLERSREVSVCQFRTEIRNSDLHMGVC